MRFSVHTRGFLIGLLVIGLPPSNERNVLQFFLAANALSALIQINAPDAEQQAGGTPNLPRVGQAQSCVTFGSGLGMPESAPHLS